MPSVAAHYFFGQEVVSRVRAKSLNTAELIEKHKEVYNLGLQGPDLLFYFKPYYQNKINELGQVIHSSPAVYLIERAARNIKEAECNEALAYLLGFACHFVLDSRMHGEINKLAPTSRKHLLLEAEMDRQIIQNFYLENANSFKRHLLVKNDIKKMDYLKQIYPEIKPSEIKKCAKSFIFYLKLLTCKTNSKKRMLEMAEALVCKDSPFTAMIVSNNVNEFFRPAEHLCVKLESTISEGAFAVENIYEHIIKSKPLHYMFNKNFE
ncbi:MAG: hypothetical protein K0R50_2806 [Eubacterium sp.]|nr:hypothetical protein [Eubacterium sp.]